MADETKIPKGRVQRSAKLGTIVGAQGAKYAGTKAGNLVRGDDSSKEKLDQRHAEAAMKMVETLGQMKGAAMKIGQFASFIDTEFIPEEYREVYQEQLAKLRSDAPVDALGAGRQGARRGVRRRADRLDVLRASTRRPSLPPRSARSTGPTLLDGREVAVKIQYPGRRRGTRIRPSQRRGPGPSGQGAGPRPRRQVGDQGDARAGPRGARLRVRGPEPALLLPGLRAGIRSSTSPT